jgi:hypothetical protein
MRRHVTAILLMSFVWASPSPACDGIDPAVFETLLLPVPQVTPGRFGSMWESRFSIYNGNGVDLNPNFPDQDIFPFDNGCQFPECPQVPVVRANSRHVPLLYPTSMPGTLLYVRREYAERVSYSLRIQDVSRQALTWGTEIPVVRESDFVSTPLQLFDVPTDERFRQALRVYETGGRDDSLVRLDVYSSEDQIIATTTLRILQPLSRCLSLVQILDLTGRFPEISAHETVRLTITPLTPGLRFWAFVSVTNNETQHVTVVSPQ